MACDILYTAQTFVQTVFLFLAVAVGLIVVIISFSYMLGSIFREEKYKSFAKKELYNLSISMLLLVLFLPFVSVVESVTCASGMSMYDYTIKGMDNILYGEIYPVLSNLYKMSIQQASLSVLKINFGPGTFKPLKFLGDISKSLNMVSFIMEMTFTSIYIQSLALSFLKVTSLNIFFPLGILFRALPYLRSYGNFLIAFSISLSTIYPYIYYISLQTYYDVLTSMNFKENVQDVISSKSFLSGTQNLVRVVDDAGFWFLSFFSYNSLRDIYFTFGRILFLSVGIPAMAIIFTVACASSISKFFREIGL